jgi:hypothetical protein
MTTGEIVILSVLGLIIYKLFTMPTKAEFDALREEMNTGLNNIADDIVRLTDSVASGELNAEAEAQVFADFRAIADKIRTIADTTPEAPTE